jgi:putative Flp pilus-assembly TadE/G-like protein
MCPVRPARNRERGAIAVLMALVLTVVMYFAAIGFDLTYIRVAKLEMANATDAAAHAAAVALSATGNQGAATTAAITVAGENYVMGRSVVLTSADLVFGSYDFTAKTFTAGTTPATAVQVVGHTVSGGDGFVNYTFGRIFGLTDANVTQNATAASMNRYFQVELQTSDDWLCEIDNAASAAVQLLTYLNGSSGYQGDWIGLDVFTGVSKQFSPLMNVRQNYNTGANLLNLWTPDTTTIGTVVGNPPYTAATMPAPPQTKGIAVCSKANAILPAVAYEGTFVGLAPQPSIEDAAHNLIPWPGGYRQCPNQGTLVPIAATASQFPFPNHPMSIAKLSCSDGGQAGLFAGTDLGAAITAGVNELSAVGVTGTDASGKPILSNEPRTLVLITDGIPMSCTGIGGGGLCGHRYSDDKVIPPANSGLTTGSPWQPCCAGGLSCGSSFTVTDAKGNSTSYGGGAWGDSNPAMSPNGDKACTAAHGLAQAAVDAADKADAKGIDVYVIGFFVDSATGGVGTGIGPDFASSLVRGKGTATITNSSAAIAGILKSIPGQVPVAIVR